MVDVGMEVSVERHIVMLVRKDVCSFVSSQGGGENVDNVIFVIVKRVVVRVLVY